DAPEDELERVAQFVADVGAHPPARHQAVAPLEAHEVLEPAPVLGGEGLVEAQPVGLPLDQREVAIARSLEAGERVGGLPDEEEDEHGCDQEHGDRVEEPTNDKREHPRRMVPGAYSRRGPAALAGPLPLPLASVRQAPGISRPASCRTTPACSSTCHTPGCRRWDRPAWRCCR